MNIVSYLPHAGELARAAASGSGLLPCMGTATGLDDELDEK